MITSSHRQETSSQTRQGKGTQINNDLGQFNKPILACDGHIGQ